MNRNGGGTLAFAVGADSELLERAREAGADPLGDLVEDGKALDGWRVTDVAEETGGRTVTLATDFAGPDELDKISQELTEALAAPEVVLLERLGVDVTDDRVDVAGTAGAVLKPAVRAYGVTPRKAARLLRRNDALEYRVSITPPGEVVETNAPTRHVSEATTQAAEAGDGSGLVWTVPPGRSIDFAVTSTRPGPPIVATVLGVIAALVIAWVVARIVIVRRRRASRRRPSAG